MCVIGRPLCERSQWSPCQARSRLALASRFSEGGGGNRQSTCLSSGLGPLPSAGLAQAAFTAIWSRFAAEDGLTLMGATKALRRCGGAGQGGCSCGNAGTAERGPARPLSQGIKGEPSSEVGRGTAVVEPSGTVCVQYDRQLIRRDMQAAYSINVNCIKNKRRRT